MSGAGNGTLHVTTWGCRDVEGETWQVWRISITPATVIGEIVLPYQASALDALIMAGNMFDPDDNWVAPWVVWPEPSQT